MNVETDELASSSSSGSTTVLPRANYSVVRVKRNIFGYSSMGAIVLDREGGSGSAYNRTAGVDMNLVLGKTTTLTALAAKTFTPGVASGDFAGGFDFAYQKDRFSYGLTYLDVGAKFNAEMGYIKRTDVRNSRARVFWTPRPHWRGVRQLTVGGSVDVYENHEGTLVSRTGDAQYAMAFEDTSTLTVDLLHDNDRLVAPWQLGNGYVATGRHSWDTFSASYVSNSSLRVAGTAAVQSGSYYSGDKTTLSAGLNLLPLARLLVETSINRNLINLPLTDAVCDEYGQHTRELLVLAVDVRQRIRAVQRRQEAGHAESPVLVHLSSRQRPLRCLQPRLGHGPAIAAHDSGAQSIVVGEVHVLVGAVDRAVGSRGRAGCARRDGDRVGE